MNIRIKRDRLRYGDTDMVCDCKQQSQQTPFLHHPPFPHPMFTITINTSLYLTASFLSLSLSLCVVSAVAMWI